MILEKDKIIFNKYRVVQIDDTCPFYYIAVVENMLFGRYEVLYLLTEEIITQHELKDALVREFKNASALASDPIPEMIYYGEIDGAPFFTRKYITGTAASEIFTDPEKFNLPEFLIFFAELLSNLIYYMQYSLIWDKISLNDIKINNGKLYFVHINYARRLKDYSNKLNEEQSDWIQKTSGFYLERSEINVYKLLYTLGELFYEINVRRSVTSALNNYRKTIEERSKLKKKKRETLPPLRLNPAISEDIESIVLKCLHTNKTGGYSSLNKLLNDIIKLISGEDIKPFIASDFGSDPEHETSTPDLASPFSKSMQPSTGKKSYGLGIPDVKIKHKYKKEINYKKYFIILFSIIAASGIIYAVLTYIPAFFKSNQIPTASAAADKKICETGNDVMLDGTKSTDPDNDKLDFFWNVDEPSNAQVIFSKNRTHDAAVTKITFLTNGNYKISLKVFDGKQFSEPSYINIIVK